MLIYDKNSFLVGAQDTFTYNAHWLRSLELVSNLKWNLLLGFYNGVKPRDFHVIYLMLWKNDTRCIHGNPFNWSTCFISDNSVKYMYLNANDNSLFFINTSTKTPTIDLHVSYQIILWSTFTRMLMITLYFRRWWSASITEIFWYPRQGVVSET